MEGLRKFLEEALQKKAFDNLSVKEIDDLIYGLHEHKTKLEVQNGNLWQTHGQLDKAQSKYSHLYDHAPVGYFTFNKNGLILEANLTSAKQLGVERELLIKKPSLNYIIEKDRNKFSLHLNKVLATKVQQSCKLELVRQDGTTFLAQLESIPIKDSNGQYNQCITSVSDITECKQTEDLLLETERKWQLLYESLPGGSFIINDQYIIENVNDTLCTVTGFTKEELIGSTCDIICPKGPHKCPIFDLGKERLDNYETAVKTKDGKFVPIIKSVRRLPLDGKEIIVENFQNITELKQMENALQKSEERFKELADLLPQTIAEIDVDGNFLYVNGHGLEAFGYTQEDINNGVNVFQTIAPQDRKKIKQNIQRKLDNKENEDHEYLALRKDGSTFPALIYSSKIIQDNEVVGLRAIIIDISDYKCMAEELKKNQKYAQNIIDSSLDMIIAVGNDRKIVEFNIAAQKTFGYTLDEILGEDINTLYEDAKDGLRIYESLMKTDKFVGEITNVRKNGETFPTLLSASILRDDDGNVIGTMGSSRDITDRKKAELALKKRLQYEETIANCSKLLVEESKIKEALQKVIEELLQVMQVSRVYIFENFENAVDGLCMRQVFKACATSITHEINNQAFQHLPYKKGFSRWQKVLSKKEVICGLVETFPQCEREILESQNILSILAFPIYMKNNWYGFIGFDDCLEKQLWKDENIKLLRTVASMIASTIERNKINSELNLERYQLLSIFDGIDEVIYISDPNTYEVLYCNLAVLKEFGNVVGKKCYKAFQNKDAPCSYCANKYIFGENLGKSHIQELHNNINKRWYRNISKAISWTDKRIVHYKLAIDITDQKNAELEIIKAKERAEEMSKLKSEFLANISHELRTPLNGILGFCQIMVEYNAPQEELQSYIDIIYKSGKHLLVMINDLLDISKIEAGKIEIEKDEVILAQLLGEINTLAVHQVIKKDVTIKLIVNTDVPEKIYTDYVRLKQILINLVGNATKFTEEGSIIIKARKNCENDNSVLFSIKDTGIGIPKKRQNIIFDSFVQLDGSSTRKYEGTGLGLFIVKQSIELLGGRVWLKSEEGKGTTFYFTINIGRLDKNTNEDTISNDEIDDVEPEETLPQKNILLVEDDNNSIKLINFIVNKLGHTLIVAKTGEQGLSLVEQSTPDLILMDIQLPIMDGIEVTKRIREQKKYDAVPIIAITAFAMKGDREKFLKAGCNDYFPKPIVVSKIEVILKQYLDDDE